MLSPYHLIFYQEHNLIINIYFNLYHKIFLFIQFNQGT